MNRKHILLYGSEINYDSKEVSRLFENNFDGFVDLKDLKIIVFSNLVLKQFMMEEVHHDRFDLTSSYGRSLRTLSAGEKRKALLEHLLMQEPDCIVLDNPFESLDVEARQELRSRIAALSQDVLIIQIVRRVADCLDFINHIIAFENRQIIYNGEVKHFIPEQKSEIMHSSVSIPPAPVDFLLPEGVLIHFRNVSVNYGVQKIVSHINWSVKQGEFWQLKGPNGSGKTTLLTMITGDNPKAFGQDIWLFGKRKGSGESVWDIKKKIGYFTPSMIELFSSSCSVEQMIISGLVDSIGLYQKATDMQRSLALQWIKMLNMDTIRNNAFKSVSDIQQRLVLIARAMIKHPPVLILDEPSAGLNDQSALLISQLINKLAQESRTAIIYVSHRSERGLQPQKIIHLIPTEDGSTSLIDDLRSI